MTRQATAAFSPRRPRPWKWWFIAVTWVCFLPGAGFGQVKMTGAHTTPPSPITLNVNDSFSCGGPGHGLLEYPDGTYLKLLAGCEGKILADGIRLKQGGMWVAYRKKGGAFVIQTPFASIGIRGTDFGLKVGSEGLNLTLVKGEVEVSPVVGEKKPILLKAGQGLVFQAGIWKTRILSPADRLPWEAFLSGGLPQSEKPPAMPRFSDQFLFGLSVMNGGRADLIGPNGSRIAVSGKGAIIRTGVTMETSPGSSAKASLLCGSSIKLAAGSRMKIGPNALHLEKGACLVRHVGKGFPLKIEGRAPIRIEGESVVSVECSGDRFVLTVEAGSAYLSRGDRRVAAGECVAVGPDGVQAPGMKPIPLAWDEPGLEVGSPPPPPDLPASSSPPTAEPDSAERLATGSEALSDFKDTLGF